jgi:hypothetical protein
MDDILKEAIADAKALRATALENAKIALEEAFTPRLKSMLSQKIQSEDLPDNEEYGEGEGEVGSGDGHMEAEGEHEDPQERKHSGMQDEEPEERPKEAMYQSDVDDKEGEVEEAEHGDMEDAGMHDDEMEPDSLEKEEEGDMEDAGMHDDDMHGEDDKDELDELDLESVIKELEEELDSSEVGDAENKEPSERANDSSEIGAQGPEGEGADEEGGKENSEDEVVKEPVTEAEHGDDKDELEEIDLEEVLQALSEEEGMEKEDEDDKKVDEMQTQLKEYKDTIGYLREKLNEVNLLNAKLLFTNKLFRSFGLNNNQKLSVVEQFDRTQNLREIKLVYATLAESFKGNGNKKVNESKGQASKAVASTEPKKEVLSEGAEMKNRFKKLANLI